MRPSSDDLGDSSGATILATGSCDPFTTVGHGMELGTRYGPVGLALEAETLVVGHVNPLFGLDSWI